MALMGKNNNRSALDDDASLFQIEESKSEKQKWSEMNTHQRLRYFLDYYLIKCLLCIAAVTITASILWSTFRPKKECILFVAVVQDYLMPQEKDQLEAQLSQLLITDTERQEIQIDDVFPSGYESNAKLSTYLGAQEIDLIMTNEERFQELAEAGCFEDLNAYLPEFAKSHADSLYWSANSSNDDLPKENSYADQPDAEEDSTASNSSNHTETKNGTAAYGVHLTDSSIFTENHDRGAVVGIVKGSLRKENAAAALTDVLFTE